MTARYLNTDLEVVSDDTGGCTELASDASADNHAGAAAHRSVGFHDAGSVRCFRKDL